MDQDKIISTWEALGTIKGTARACQVSPKTVLKVLSTHGIAATEQAEQVQAMAEHMSVEEIAAQLKISTRTVQTYLPYTRGTYLSDEKSPNALKLKAWRENKAQSSK